MRCEVFDYEADENINTSISEVDESVKDFGYITTLNMVKSGAAPTSAIGSLASSLAAVYDGSVSKIDLINDGTGYLTTPTISISRPISGGVNATAVAIMTSRSNQTGKSIDKIMIINPGIGYTVIPSVTIVSSSGSGAIATAIVSSGSLGTFQIVSGGVGYSTNPIVAISTAPSGGTNAIAECVINSLGIVTAIRYSNAGSGYTSIPSISFSSPIGVSTGNYVFNEIVKGVSTGTTAHVADWDYDTRILKVKIASGSFALGESIVGIGTTFGGSNSNYKLLSVNTQDEYDPYAENIPIESEADEFLDFSERNPFGDF